MQEEIKCPQCGGSMFNKQNNDSYRCMYCGVTFTNKTSVDYARGNNSQSSTSVPPNFTININDQPMQNYNNRPYSRGKSKSTAVLLALILGDFGIHHFYLNRPGLGILYLIFFWTWIPCVVGFIEGLIYLGMTTQEFDEKYNHV